MPPKTTKEHVAKMMVQQVTLDRELAEVQEEAAHEEKQHAEEAAAREKKEHEKCDAEHKQEDRELTAAKARVAKYEVEAKVRAESGGSLGGSNASSDDEVRITGMMTKVSDRCCVTIIS